MKIYYLDEPLDEADLIDAKELLIQYEGLRSIQNLEQIRVASVLPIPGIGEHQKHIDLFRNLLEKAGVKTNSEEKSIWAVPKDTYWSGIAVIAMGEMTGFYPYILKRWGRNDEGQAIRQPPILINTNGMMGA